MGCREPLDPLVHERLIQLFHYYLAVGGMPAAVQAYVDSGNLQEIRRIQEDITEFYRNDITRYCNERDVLLVKRIFDLMPAQLNQQNKRFIATSVGKDVRVGKDENRFIWLAEAGVAIPVCNVAEPRFPLMLAEEASLFKLFMSDVGSSPTGAAWKSCAASSVGRASTTGASTRTMWPKSCMRMESAHGTTAAKSLASWTFSSTGLWQGAPHRGQVGQGLPSLSRPQKCARG